MNEIHIGVVTVRDETYHPNRRLMEAAQKAGHRCCLINPYELWPAVMSNRAFVVPEEAFLELDVVIPRQGAQIGDSSLALIRHIEVSGVPVINDSKTIAVARSQVRTLQMLCAHGIPIPDTVFVNHVKGGFYAVKQLGGWPVVAKPVSGRQGKGVTLLSDENALKRRFSEDFHKQKGVLIQRYIKPETRRDFRLLIIGNTIQGMVELIPVENEFRSNYHLGGRIQMVQLPQKVQKIALQAASAIGAQIAGVDMMIEENGKPVVVEVNFSPGFKGMEKATGLDIAGKIISYACRQV